MDELEFYRAELQRATMQIDTVGIELARSARTLTDRQSDYEEAKNSTLLALYAEETKDGFKRTEAHRTAIYRQTHSDLRRAFYTAKADHEGNVALLKGVMAKVNALQSLFGFEREKMKLGIGTSDTP